MALVRYVVHDEQGKILSTGICSEANLKHKEAKGLKVIRGIADDRFNKVVDDKIVDKEPDEIEPELPVLENLEPLARISQKDWQAVLSRLAQLEKNGR